MLPYHLCLSEVGSIQRVMEWDPWYLRGSNNQLDILSIHFDLLSLFCSLRKFLPNMDINLDKTLRDKSILLNKLHLDLKCPLHIAFP
jgi:hypothetical protein